MRGAGQQDAPPAGGQQHPELPKGVGSTALLIAITRAEAKKLKDPPFEDPYAAPLARPLYDAQTDGYPILSQLSEQLGGAQSFVAANVIRSMWFDEQVNFAVREGIKQLVNLGAGMDTRPFRMEYAEGSHFFEVDFPAVFEYKNSVLQECGAEPKCHRHCLTADVTKEGWIDLLKENGFNPQERTLWILEGLTMYLAEKENKDLLSYLLSASAVGSRVAVLTMTEERLQKLSKYAGHFAAQNIQFKYGTSDPGALLSGCGWTVGEVSFFEDLCLRRFNRPDLFDPKRDKAGYSAAYKS